MDTLQIACAFALKSIQIGGISAALAIVVAGLWVVISDARKEWRERKRRLDHFEAERRVLRFIGRHELNY